MDIRKIFTYTASFIVIILVFSGCSPKKVNSDKENLKSTSLSWIPFQNTESVIFEFDTMTMVFTGTGREKYYENVRYMTDQSGFINSQTDYYADLERQFLSFESPTTTYIINYYLERNKGETGDWDILEVSMIDGDFYSNKIKKVLYENAGADYGEIYKFRKSLNIAGKSFSNVYYRIQDRRPFEIYYTQLQGIVAFKLSSSEMWTIRQ
jgi:asparagine N-glycosylation enzyme membrane subunit Stt3